MYGKKKQNRPKKSVCLIFGTVFLYPTAYKSREWLVLSYHESKAKTSSSPLLPCPFFQFFALAPSPGEKANNSYLTQKKVTTAATKIQSKLVHSNHSAVDMPICMLKRGDLCACNLRVKMRPDSCMKTR